MFHKEVITFARWERVVFVEKKGRKGSGHSGKINLANEKK